VSLVRLRPVRMVNHLPSVLWHCCKNNVSESSGKLNISRLSCCVTWSIIVKVLLYHVMSTSSFGWMMMMMMMMHAVCSVKDSSILLPVTKTTICCCSFLSDDYQQLIFSNVLPVHLWGDMSLIVNVVQFSFVWLFQFRGVSTHMSDRWLC